MDEKLSEKIALFRYGLIAPVIHESGKGQMRYFRMLSQKIFDVPHHGAVFSSSHLQGACARLKIALVHSKPFNDNALRSLYQNSCGIPRVINSIAIKAMTIGAIEKKDVITEEEIYKASREC